MLLHHTSCNFLGKVTSKQEIIYNTIEIFIAVLLSVAVIVVIVNLVYIVIKHFVNKVRTH